MITVLIHTMLAFEFTIRIDNIASFTMGDQKTGMIGMKRIHFRLAGFLTKIFSFS